MSALMMALMLGLGMRAVQADSLRKGISELQKLVMLSIEKAIIPLLPVYIFGVFLKMSASGGIIELASNFLWVILLVIAMLVVWTLFLYGIAGLLAHRNPFKLLWAMMPAGMVAFATCSSAATIPVSLERAKHLTRDENTASFVIPLCANLHIPSVSIHFVICAIAVMMMVGQPVELGSFIPYMIMLTMTCVAVPGVPGGVVAVLPVMASMLGFTPEMQALCLSLGVLLDAPLTAMNVLCDGAVCTIVDNRVNNS
jgi:Na+/H+-dicarboxylate symporter